MRIFGTSEVHHQYNIWSAGKAHHQVLEKGGTYLLQYTAQIFPDVDALYLLIISIFNTTEMLCTSQLRVHQGAKFPCTYIHHFLPQILILELSDSCFLLARSYGNVASENSCLSFSFCFKSRKY